MRRLNLFKVKGVLRGNNGKRLYCETMEMVVQDNLGATKRLCKEGKESLRILAIVVVGIWSDFFFFLFFFFLRASSNAA